MENKDLIEQLTEEELKELSEEQEVKASASEIIAKPKDLKEIKKANASEMTEEEKRKNIEDNIIGEFYD